MTTDLLRSSTCICDQIRLHYRVGVKLNFAMFTYDHYVLWLETGVGAGLIDEGPADQQAPALAFPFFDFWQDLLFSVWSQFESYSNVSAIYIMG